MLSRKMKAVHQNPKIKTILFAVASPLMKINGILYRYLRSPRTAFVKVQLGPGSKKYLESWINLDANILDGKCDVWADLRNQLPFHDATIDAIYSHHVIEHLPNLEFHFADVYRCLKPGGIYRVGGPNGDAAIMKFIENDKKWFKNLLDKRDSIGGKFESFIFCGRQHLTILTFSYLEEVMSKAGFKNIRRCLPAMETSAPEVFQECLKKERVSDFEFPHTLIVEGERPKG